MLLYIDDSAGFKGAPSQDINSTQIVFGFPIKADAYLQLEKHAFYEQDLPAWTSSPLRSIRGPKPQHWNYMRFKDTD